MPCRLAPQDLLGMAAGHAYYFLEDVYPRMSGRRLLKTPGFVRALFPQARTAALCPTGNLMYVQGRRKGQLCGP
jgi:hypothetical protein